MWGILHTPKRNIPLLRLTYALLLVGGIGIRGDKEQGVRELRVAAEKGLYNQDDAAVMLLAVYQREGKPQEALPLLEKLSAKYPRNYLVRLETASMLNRLGRASDACAVFEALLRDKSANAEDLIRYQYGEALAVNREYLRAAEQFVTVTRAAGAEHTRSTRFKNFVELNPALFTISTEAMPFVG